MSNTRKRTAARAAEKAKPELLGQGRYAIYQTPEGDGVVTYRPDGVEEDQHQVVPARFWAMLMKILSGEMSDINPMVIMKMLMGK
jgi:hypothetical protein